MSPRTDVPVALPAYYSKAKVYAEAAPLIQRDPAHLAPGFRSRLGRAMLRCRNAGYDVVINEAYRSDELQRLYYTLGRRHNADGSWTLVNAEDVVTYAASAQYSWHFYGLAADLKSQAKGYQVSQGWWAAVHVICRTIGLDCGADWRRPDIPHVQFGTLKPGPSDKARELYAAGGLCAVWQAVGAN